MEQPRRDLPERTFEFAKRIVKFCQRMEQKPGSSRVLANQLLRAGTSIGANVQEGQAGQSRADFLSKYSIACKEARETHYWLRLIAATDGNEDSELQTMIEEANQLVSILIAIINNTKKNAERRK
jgi:four helix bundle protein